MPSATSAGPPSARSSGKPAPSSNRMDTSPARRPPATVRRPTCSPPDYQTTRYRQVESLRLHFMRNALALVPKGAQQMVAATIRTVFAQPDAASAREQWRRVADGFRDRFPRLADLMDEAESDVSAYLAFPAAHWRQVWANNRL